MIEKKKVHFLLTGSSARKLRRSGVNLLGGRARTKKLFPLISRELEKKFSLLKALETGLIPSIYFSPDPQADLKSYVSDYLMQEIAAEGVSRNIPGFSRFLEVAALSNGQMLNYQEIGSDAEVKRGTVQNYFEILEDTLIGYRLQPWLKSKSRKAIRTEKLYFFDTGVVNSLAGREKVSLKTPEAGFLFETFLIHEVRSYVEYSGRSIPLSYWKSTSQFEVDLLLDDEVAIEMKAKTSIQERDLKGLQALGEEKMMKKKIIIYLGDRVLHFGDIEVIPYALFLERLWAREII